MDNLADLFFEELREVLNAEKQLVKALPKMAQKATSEELQAAFEKHLSETETHVKRLEQAFAETGKKPHEKACEAMKGLIAEVESMMKEKSSPDAMDAALIACVQKIEHYEIATYGTLCTWAETLGYTKALQLLKQTINEEERTDEALTQLSKTVNRLANV